ncbi:MAG: ATP-binding protein [Proteobacteria bacterium]|nr:ATP-binding protein [Pseudomonadota bacterium]
MTALELLQNNVFKFIGESSIIFILQEAGEPYHIRFVSTNVKKILGLEERDILPDIGSWIKRIHKEDREKYIELVNGSFNKGNFIEYRFLDKEGSVRWLREEFRKFIIENESVILRTIVDVTTCRKQAELYNEMFNNIEEGLVVFNRKLEIKNVNAGFCKIIGFSCDELIGKNFLEIFEVKGYLLEKKVLKEQIDYLIINKNSQKVSIRLFNKLSQPRYVDVHLYPIRPVTSDSVEALVGVFIDITEKKHLEDQLSYIQKMETIGQLSAGIAHDFNNLLTAIIGFASFIDMKIEEGNPLKVYAQNILKVSERGANLVKNLLTFSRKREFQPSRVDINRLILNSDPLLRKMTGEYISIKYEMAKEELPVMVDITQMEQVLLNLVSNAKDAITGSGEIRISTKPFKIDEDFMKRNGFGYPGDYALITVSDNGIGMSEEVKKKAFEPFFTTKDINKGTGLGLSIVYGIIKQHNGYITIDSNEGIGTKVNIYLPALKEHKPTEEEIKREFLNVKGGSETILVAEDDDYVRDLINQILSNAGYKVVLARDGKEAISEFIKRKKEISLAIIDVIMPIKNGGEVFNEIRLINPTIKVIFLSGYSMEFVNNEAKISKHACFMAKPISPKELLLKVRQTLDGII